MTKNYFFICLLGLHLIVNGQSQLQPLPNAHAHNDYEQAHPLYDALQHGFTSVEVDVHLIGEELYVAHDRPADLERTPTLESLYLQPLAHWLRQNEGQVYPGYEDAFFLMIDIKTKAGPTYLKLREVLMNYQDMLLHYKDEVLIGGPVLVFLSGNRPIDLVQAEKLRLVGIDGRPADIGKGYSASLMPVISDNYRRHLSWRGKGRNKRPKEVEKLQTWIEQAHAEGKKVRLWASPENRRVWQLLLQIGVDFLNTDKLADLQGFLLEKKQ